MQAIRSRGSLSEQGGLGEAPVLALWAAVVAEGLGFERDEALALGRAVAGLNAYAKGASLGLFQPSQKSLDQHRKKLKTGETLAVELLYRAMPVIHTPEGLRAVSKNQAISPASVDRYLASKFGEALEETRAAMIELARSMKAKELAARAYSLYEQFRPSVPEGVRGWGAKGRLDLASVRGLAEH
jgi:hypothetical protein